MGVELFRLEMTPSTLIVVIVNKEFYENNYHRLNAQGMLVNYDVIQSLINLRLFFSDKVFLPDSSTGKTIPRQITYPAD